MLSAIWGICNTVFLGCVSRLSPESEREREYQKTSPLFLRKQTTDNGLTGFSYKIHSLHSGSYRIVQEGLIWTQATLGHRDVLHAFLRQFLMPLSCCRMLFSFVISFRAEIQKIVRICCLIILVLWLAADVFWNYFLFPEISSSQNKIIMILLVVC